MTPLEDIAKLADRYPITPPPSTGASLAIAGPPVPPAYGPHWLPGSVRRHLPPLLLMAFAITIPELLTGSTAVLTILVNPLALLFLLGLYGGGVLTIREIAIRWRKGWPTVLLLGLAYGIVEEGFGTKTFFDPASTGAGGLATFGHWGGVSWVWVADISVFHAIFSIGLPILLVGLLFPATRGQVFLKGRNPVLVFAAFLFTATTMYFLFDAHYTPSLLVLAFFAGLSIALVLLGWGAPSRWGLPARRSGMLTPRSVGLLSGLFVWLTFGVYWILPAVVRIPAAVVAVEALLIGGVGWYVVREFESGEPRFRLAIATGLLSFLLVFSVVVELLGDRLAFLATASILAVLFLIRRIVFHSEDAFHRASPASPT